MFPNPDLEHKVLTRSGRLLDLLDPQPEDITMEDIAHGLSRQFRYAGALGDYTVAQHSIHVMQSVRSNWPGDESYGLKDAMRLALLHDASEAYIHDMPTPAKILLSDYVNLEHRIMGAIFKKFNVVSEWTQLVKEADASMCGTEVRLFLPKRTDLDDLFPKETLPFEIEHLWTPNEAKRKFILAGLGIESFVPEAREASHV